MDQFNGKSASWRDEELLESTADPSISLSAIAEDVPALTLATIIGVTILMLIAIVAVFLLGVLIDCRQQRVIATKISEAKRLKNQRRENTQTEDDSANIANNMEEAGMSLPPAEVLKTIP